MMLQNIDKDTDNILYYNEELRAFMEAWYTGLTSGKYQPCTGTLENEYQQMCCLGVATRVINTVFPIDKHLRLQSVENPTEHLQVMYNDAARVSCGSLPQDWSKQVFPLMEESFATYICFEQRQELFHVLRTAWYSSAERARRYASRISGLHDYSLSHNAGLASQCAYSLAEVDKHTLLELVNMMGLMVPEGAWRDSDGEVGCTSVERFRNWHKKDYVVADGEYKNSTTLTSIFVLLNDNYQGWDLVIPFLRAIIRLVENAVKWDERVTARIAELQKPVDD